MTKAAELAKMGEVLTNSQIGGRRNIIINGAMQVAQRGTSVSSLGGTNNDYQTVDRFKIIAVSTAGRVTMSQADSGLSGFKKSLKLQVTTADTSIASGELFGISQAIEGQDLQQLKKGTSDAEQVTLSYYVKGNAAANYTVEISDADNTRHNTQSFSVTTDWTRVVHTFAADTTGALDNDNATSFQIAWWLHAGSDFNGGTFTENTWASRTNANRVDSNDTSFFDSTDRTFEITGVQLEVGSTATPFEHRSNGEELLLCQRYYREFGGDSTNDALFAGMWYSATTVYCPVQLLPHMRAAPTVSRKTTNSGDFFMFGVGFSDNADQAVGSNIRHNNFRFYMVGGTSRTAGHGTWTQTADGQAITCDAEL